MPAQQFEFVFVQATITTKHRLLTVLVQELSDSAALNQRTLLQRRNVNIENLLVKINNFIRIN